MYSDSDDSQLSQPHLSIKKVKSSTKESKSEDVVDRERSSDELISFSATLETETDVKKLDDDSPIILPRPTSAADKLLMKFSSNSSSESPKSTKLSSESSNDSMSSEDDETSLGEALEDEDDEKRLINKSQQTSPTLLGKLGLFKNLESMDSHELDKYASIQSLESTLPSPEPAPIRSKYLQNLDPKQLFYYDQNQSFESLDTIFSKLKLNYKDTNKPSTSQRYGIFNFEFDEELFYSVKKSFPQVSDEKIRNSMYKHHNQEHDVIRAIVDSLSPKREKRMRREQTQMDKVLGHYIKNRPKIDQSDEERIRLMAKDEKAYDNNYGQIQIRIKYLKFLYPDVKVEELFHHLHNCDMKANNVAKKLEELGFKRRSLTDSEESLISHHSFEELMPELGLGFGEQENRISLLQKEYPMVNIYLVKQALKSTKFNFNEAKKLLDTVDLDQYKNLKTYDFDWLSDDSKYVYKTDRGTQTCLIDCIEYGRTYRTEKQSDLCSIKCKSTWTKEDLIQQKSIQQIAKGRDKKNYKGPAKRERMKLIKPNGPDPGNCNVYGNYIAKGPDPDNVKGSGNKKLKNFKSLACGPDYTNCRGSFKTKSKNFLDDEPIEDPIQNFLYGI